MSILIKGMKMPENCEECNLESFCDLWVDAKRMCGEGFTDSKARVKATIRHPNCPLIEVSTSHGRLIDADALKDKWIWGDTDRLGHTEVVEVIDIDDAPTIIESEKEQ